VYDDIGGTTRDNLTAGKPLPAEQVTGEPDDEPDDKPGKKPGIPDLEKLNRRYGLILMIGGLAVVFLTVTGILLFEENLRGSRPPFVTMSVIIAFLSMGVTGIAVGLQEILQRYGRHLTRKVLAKQAEQARRLHDAMSEQAEQVRLLRELTTAMDLFRERLAAIELAIAKVPDYGAGVIDGMQIRQSAGQQDGG
jgi:hypothetical protein